MATTNHTISIPLNKGYVTVIDEADRDLLAFHWNVTSGEKYDCYYAQAYVRGKNRLLHRLILARMIGRPLRRNEYADHIDRNGLNNRRDNLRLATNAENLRNRPRQRNNKSGYKGVCFDKRVGRWRADIGVDGRSIKVGRYDTAEEAARAYDTAAREHFGEFAYLNFPDDPRPEFDLPRGQMVVRVEDADNINVIFVPPIPCVMRDPDGRQREIRLGDTDALVALVFAGWQMVEVVA